MERRAIRVTGIVQGVGFRPFVYGLATRLGLAGSVKNSTGIVMIEVEGEAALLDQFLEEIQSRPPRMASIDRVSWEEQPLRSEASFRIDPSEVDASGHASVPADIAVCPDCLAEMLDPRDRRYGYPFINCTNCGPRLTIIEGGPYDRQRTTMSRFAMCAACRAEYNDPQDRRFHAQPIACPACGPQIEVCQFDGTAVAMTETRDSLSFFATALLDGKIGALKGLGGFHLVCIASNATAVSELRRRKLRDEKPFAIMVADAAAAERLCELDDRERALLESARAPIVLLRKRDRREEVCESVAPGNPYVGVMLPYTPLHHLILSAVRGAPLVMTSGNRSDEPIAYENGPATEELSPIAEIFLMHNRPIHVRCDDSVTRIVDGRELPIRRSRGYAPQPIKLPSGGAVPTLAVGGQLKGCFGLGDDGQAFLSHHLGDLDHFEAYKAFERDIRLYEQLFSISPRLLVHDLHPDYASTGYARSRSARQGLACLAVQHHHAHMASCMAENGVDEPVIGVAFDGTGYGPDGAIWGGEFLVGDLAQYQRAAHLRYVRLPGGDRAAKEPWRIALSYLREAGCQGASLGADVTPREIRAVEQMLYAGFNSPWTSSAGRLFDAVSALVGIRSRVSYEGQAAMQLEWLAAEVEDLGVYPFDLISEPVADIIDTRPLIREVVREVQADVSQAIIARRFHNTVVKMVADVCERIRSRTGLGIVVLSGGVFMNALLTQGACDRLRRSGFQVHRHRLVPPNDGGLSLGQLAVAAATEARNRSKNVPH